jgi:hypothetical protein
MPGLTKIDAIETPALLDGAKIYQTPSGWIYEVWFQGRLITIGCRVTLEAARREAAGL